MITTPIKLNVVRLASGVYIGRTYSDRWNMRTIHEIGGFDDKMYDLNKCRSQKHIDAFRQNVKTVGLSLFLRIKSAPVFAMTPNEQTAMAGWRKYVPLRLRMAS